MNLINYVVLTSIMVVLISSCGSNNTKPGYSEKDPQNPEENPRSTKSQQPIKFPLTIGAPQGSRIRIMNIVPKYTAGILLEKGKYNIQITKPGYKTFRQWIEVDDEKQLTVTLEKSIPLLAVRTDKEPSTSIITNGDFLWEKNSSSKKNPYNYIIRNFDGYLWSNIRPNDGYGKSGTRSWSSAKKYCDKLSIDIKGVRLDEFEMPDKNSLLTLWRYRHYSTFYSNSLNNSSVWANETILSKGGRHMAKMFFLTDGAYSDWLDSGVKRQSHPTVSNPICVSKKAINLSHLGLIDFKKTKHMSVREIANRIFTSKSRHLSRPPHKKTNKNSIAYIDALSMAFYIKHGSPVIKNSNYDTSKEIMNVILASSRSNFNKLIKIPVKKKFAKKITKLLHSKHFSPEVEIKIVKSQLLFGAITQLKDPEFL